MSQRLNQISNRGWSGHGAVFANHSDPGHGYWYNHGGGWWRCNYWGANWYCDHLIGLGFAPGLCWAWYDDICWGNIVIGMPVTLDFRPTRHDGAVPVFRPKATADE